MKETPSERRQAENEVVFRQLNEQLKKAVDEHNTIAKVDKQSEYMIIPEDQTLHFYCECSDENCTQRVKISYEAYNEFHEQRNHFVAVPGHEVPAIERIVRKEPEYYVLEKFVTPPEHVGGLSPTSVDNS